MAVLRIRQRRGHQCLTVTTVNQSSCQAVSAVPALPPYWGCDSLHGSTTEPNPSIKAESNTSTRANAGLCGGGGGRRCAVASVGGCMRPINLCVYACSASERTIEPFAPTRQMPGARCILIVLLCCKMCMRSCPGREAEAQIPRMEKMRLL